jgi:hypothetical protein
MRSIILTVTLSVIALLAACDDSDDSAPAPDNNSPAPVIGDPPQSPPVKQGVFTGYEHNLSGLAAFYDDAVAGKSIYLEGFTMTQGPDVRVYISRASNYSKANTIEIGRLKDSYTRQNIGIAVPGYTAEYKFILVYCLEFHALFGYAELK